MINKRKARVLTNVKIDEVSVVDAGAGENCHVKLLKRDTTFGGYPVHGMRKNTGDIPFDPHKINPGGAEDDQRDDEAVRLAAEMDSDADRDDDDDSLDIPVGDNDGADPNGAPTKHLDDLVEELDKREDQTTMNLMTIAKQPRALCASTSSRTGQARFPRVLEVTGLLTAVARKKCIRI